MEGFTLWKASCTLLIGRFILFCVLLCNSFSCCCSPLYLLLMGDCSCFTLTSHCHTPKMTHVYIVFILIYIPLCEFKPLILSTNHLCKTFLDISGFTDIQLPSLNITLFYLFSLPIYMQLFALFM